MKPIQKATLVVLGCAAAILLIGVPADTLPVGWWITALVMTKLSAWWLYTLTAKLYKRWTPNED